MEWDLVYISICGFVDPKFRVFLSKNFVLR